MDILSNFSETLENLLIENDLTATEFADAIGVKNSTVYDYLNKEYIPKTTMLISIADYFNCTTDFLLGLESESSSKTFYKYKPFAEQIEVIKKRYAKSEYFIIKNANLSEKCFYDWKRGKHTPSVENLIKIAKLFNCSLDYVLGRSKH